MLVVDLEYQRGGVSTLSQIPKCRFGALKRQLVYCRKRRAVRFVTPRLRGRKRRFITYTNSIQGTKPVFDRTLMATPSNSQPGQSGSNMSRVS